MATDLARHDVGRERPDPSQAAETATEVIDLVPLHLRPAHEAPDAPGFLEVDVVAPPTPRRVEPPALPVVAVAVLVGLAAVLAPLLVVVGATALPVAEPVQGAVVVAGWISLGIAVRWRSGRAEGRR